MMYSQQLTDLPWDDVVFRYILPYLSTVELFRLRSVSHSYLQMHEEYMKTCQKLDFSNSRLTVPVFRELLKDCQSLRWFSIAKCTWITDDALMEIFRKNRLLEYVDLTGCSSLCGGALQVLAVSCKKLKTLILEECHWLTQGGLEVITLHLSKLQHVNVSNTWAIEDPCNLEGFFRKFHNLQRFHVANVDSVSDIMLLSLASHCRNLEYLDVSGCWRITDKGLMQVVEYCPHLKGLDVRRCRDVSETYLASLYVKGIQVKTQYPLSLLIKQRKQVERLRLNVQI